MVWWWNGNDSLDVHVVDVGIKKAVRRLPPSLQFSLSPPPPHFFNHNHCFLFFRLEKVCQGTEAIWKELLQDQKGTAFSQRNGKDFCIFSNICSVLWFCSLLLLKYLYNHFLFFSFKRSFFRSTGRPCRVLLHMEKDSHSTKFSTTQASET